MPHVANPEVNSLTPVSYIVQASTASGNHQEGVAKGDGNYYEGGVVQDDDTYEGYSATPSR